jgi:CheY-like chemotaxis protein
MIARLLRSKGYEVGTAGTVDEALEAINRGGFDVLLSDLGLPDGTGCDLMRKVAEQGHQIKGIALSGYGTAEDISRSLEAGFLAHLVKPVSFQSLHDALQSVGGVIK